MSISRRTIRRIIQEAMPPGGVPDVVGALTGVYGEAERQRRDSPARVGELMLIWNELQVGDLVDVDTDYNFYGGVRITDKLDDVSLEAGLPPGPGFVGDHRGDEIVFSVDDVDPTSYEKYALAERKTMKITKRQLRRIIKEEKARLMEYGGRPYDPTKPGDFERYRDNPTGDAPRGVPGPDAGSIKAARKALNRALTIFERMGYDEAADHVVAAIEAIDSPEGTY